MGEVKKAMFQGVACYFEFIFGLLTFPKCDFGEFEKAIIKVSNWILNLFSASGLAENAIW